MVQLLEGAEPLMEMPMSAKFHPEKGPDERHCCSRGVCTLLWWQPRAFGVTSHHRWLEIWNPHRDITDSTLGLVQSEATAQVSFPSAKLEQYTCDSHPLNLIYEVGSILPLYSQGIPCNSIWEIFAFIYHRCTFLISFPREIKFIWFGFFSYVFSCVCLPNSPFSLKTGQWLMSFGTWVEFNSHIWVSRRWKRWWNSYQSSHWERVQNYL